MDRKLRIFHGADFHLDTPFGPADFGTPAQRRDQLRRAAEELLDRAADCDLVLLAGDIFDAPRVYPESTKLLSRVFERLALPVFIAPGNHDPYGPDSPWARCTWPDNVHIFSSSQVQAVDLPDLGTTVYGAGFTGSQAKDLLAGFFVRDPDRLNVMVLHGDATSAESIYNGISTGQIADSGLDYLALGHLHAPSGLIRAGAVFYAWPGCLLGRDFGETGQKGAYLVQVDKSGCALTFLQSPGPRWECMSCQAAGDAAAAVRAAVAAVRPGDHLRLTVTGFAAPFDPAELAKACRGDLACLELTDETVSLENLWGQAGTDSLRGLFLANLLPQAQSEDPEQRELARLAAVYGLAALEGREEP